MSLMKGYALESCAPFWCPILVYGWQGGLATSGGALEWIKKTLLLSERFDPKCARKNLRWACARRW